MIYAEIIKAAGRQFELRMEVEDEPHYEVTVCSVDAEGYTTGALLNFDLPYSQHTDSEVLDAIYSRASKAMAARMEDPNITPNKLVELADFAFPWKTVMGAPGWTYWLDDNDSLIGAPTLVGGAPDLCATCPVADFDVPLPNDEMARIKLELGESKSET